MISKNKLMTVMFGVAVSATGFAEEAKVDATKSASMVSVLPNFYSNLQLRHTTNVGAAGDKTTGTETFAQARYTLGSTFLNEKIDANVVLGATKKNSTNVITQRRTFAYVIYNAFSNDNVTISPYAEILLPHNGSGTDANLSLYTDAKKNVGTAIGKLVVSASAEAQGLFGSRATQIEVGEATEMTEERREQLGLTGEKKDMVEAQAAGIATEYGLTIGLSDAGRVKGLTAKATAYVDRDFTPNMKPTIIEGEERVAMAGYQAVNSSYNLYTVSYKIGDTGMSVTNETFQRFSGVYSGRKNGTDSGSDARWTNVARLTTTF